jgi:hypothetical protein
VRDPPGFSYALLRLCCGSFHSQWKDPVHKVTNNGTVETFSPDSKVAAYLNTDSSMQSQSHSIGSHDAGNDTTAPSPEPTHWRLVTHTKIPTAVFSPSCR